MIKRLKLTNEEFAPDVIMNSGQVFRMYKDGGELTDGIPGVYRALSGSNEVTFSFDMENDNWCFVCEDGQWDFWNRYFDFDTDYIAFNDCIRKSNDSFLKDALGDAFGMRILRQDLWETFISYMISQNNNIPKIKKSIQILCDRYSDGVAFPTARELAMAGTDQLSKGTMLGYRADYISGFAKDVYDGKIILEDYEKKSYDEAVDALLKVKGVGPKVAACIALYGLHLMESYPIDTWMKKIIAEDYREYSKDRYMEYLKSYAGFEGYVQQLQFYHKRLQG